MMVWFVTNATMEFVVNVLLVSYIPYTHTCMYYILNIVVWVVVLNTFFLFTKKHNISTKTLSFIPEVDVFIMH